ncbi:hypothetical protein BDP55DRAFT_325440 [Colletotrichum godetiae]|uniref:Uncharacterized protein n=1 Tax=Colletotrichum godetiae TaxID=1209918 RepID=A0AAJ0ABQ7_9PEZI|nr:uncharacterized protein BDP55DRAFT_325440 [Colletotrichum godetiae]KAK1660111.1 hypothetical protein BDP55DRAFT_325440 [Colletotrichum godetiae]
MSPDHRVQYTLSPRLNMGTSRLQHFFGALPPARLVIARADALSWMNLPPQRILRTLDVSEVGTLLDKSCSLHSKKGVNQTTSSARWQWCTCSQVEVKKRPSPWSRPIGRGIWTRHSTVGYRKRFSSRLPDEECRRPILWTSLNKDDLDDDEDLTKLAIQTAGYFGSHLRSVCAAPRQR